MKHYDELTALKPANGQKSFYGKAHYFETDGTYVLMSYDTYICDYEPKTGYFFKRWEGYSRTTMNHIKSFCAMFRIFPNMTKKQWDSIPTYGGIESLGFKVPASERT